MVGWVVVVGVDMDGVKMGARTAVVVFGGNMKISPVFERIITSILDMMSLPR